MNTSPSNPIQQVAAQDVLVIEIHNPPINAGSLGVRQGILDAIEQLSRSTVWRAGVITGAGSTAFSSKTDQYFLWHRTHPRRLLGKR